MRLLCASPSSPSSPLTLSSTRGAVRARSAARSAVRPIGGHGLPGGVPDPDVHPRGLNWVRACPGDRPPCPLRSRARHDPCRRSARAHTEHPVRRLAVGRAVRGARHLHRACRGLAHVSLLRRERRVRALIQLPPPFAHNRPDGRRRHGDIAAPAFHPVGRFGSQGCGDALDSILRVLGAPPLPGAVSHRALAGGVGEDGPLVVAWGSPRSASSVQITELPDDIACMARGAWACLAWIAMQRILARARGLWGWGKRRSGAARVWLWLTRARSF